MEKAIAFKREEQVALGLRRLFERRGFRRVSVNKFEDYDLYIDNRNFLRAEKIITFMDMDGKLLALKPDVTLSVVKNIPNKTLPAFEKLYYLDEVYRLSKENREYKVLSQIGVELIGPTDAFSGLEVIDLALESLEEISASFVLDISHLGFLSGLLEQLALSAGMRKQLLADIHAKSLHDVRRTLEQAECHREDVERALALCELHGTLHHALPRAKALIGNDCMREAYDELAAVGKALEQAGQAKRVNLDFSVVNDVDYYNGLIFQGYVEGAPGVVLTGGRYDNLMARMGKRNGAIGFAVYLSELGAQRSGGSGKDYDYLITYGPDADSGALLGEIRRLNREGFSVRVEREDCDLAALGFTYERHCRMTISGLEEAR